MAMESQESKPYEATAQQAAAPEAGPKAKARVPVADEPGDPPPEPAADPAPTQPFEAALLGYLDALQGAWLPLEAVRKSGGAYRQFLDTLDAPAEPGPGQGLAQFDSYCGYLRLMDELWAPDRCQARVAAVYQDYLAALRAAWVEADLARLDPAMLHAVASSMALVASSAVQTPPPPLWHPQMYQEA
ncbi:hypothetical protein [Azorhizobium doebereinerae]|uniref:hypothetical protein n=1 Tax=Azorhizobium doebereinerae TaxID=281091 RepID=UPI0003FAB387|nr:hypothetical protein [Azorhizobium doebereinerae]